MIKRRSQILCFLFLVSDVLLTSAAWIAAYYVRCRSGWVPLEKDSPDLVLCLRQIPVVAVLAAIGYHLVGQYEVNRLRRLREEVVGVVKGTALLALLVMATLFFERDGYESRGIIVLFSVLNMLAVLTGRRLAWGLIRLLRSRGFNQKVRPDRRHRPGGPQDVWPAPRQLAGDQEYRLCR